VSADTVPAGLPGPGRSPVSRRAFGTGLAAVTTALLTAGCDPDDGLDLPGLPAIGNEPDNDRVVAGLRDEQAVLDRVARVRQEHRALRSALAPTEAVHQSHVDLLGRAVEDSERAGGPGGSTGSGARDSGRVPGDPAQAVAELIVLERGLAERHVATSVTSRSGTLARVVAAMSAAAAQQAVVLAPLAVRAAAQGG
jgi:hypothetical protein